MRRRRRRKFLSYKLYLFIGLLVVIVIVIINLRFLTIQKVDVGGNVSCIENPTLLQTKKLLGQNFFLVDKKDIENDIQKKYICVGQINLNKKFPSSIQIEIKERQPKVVIININKESSQSADILNNLTADASTSSQLNWENFPKKESFLADSEGVIFSDSVRENLPKVYFFSNINLGQRVEGELIQKILKVQDQLNVLGMNINGSLLTFDNTYFVYSNPKIYFDLKGNLDFQLASLQLILKTAKINQEVTFIDLRFDKPVIRFATKDGKE